jgi:hypothetical protein
VRSFITRYWIEAVVAVVLFLIGIGIGAGTAGTKTKTETVAGPTVTNTVTTVKTVSRVRVRTVKAQPPPQPPPPPPPPAEASDKHFSVESLQVKDNGLGDIGGIARVTNNSTESLTATFTFTFFQGSRIVGTAIGSASAVSPGQTVTVELASTDPMISGSFRYQFQVDVEF